jgi:hypothetical protein
MTTHDGQNRAPGGPLVELIVLPNEAVAEVVRDAFAERSIDAEFSPAFDVLPPFGVRVGTPVRVRVRLDDTEAAHAALDDVRSEAEAFDWDDIDVGEAEDPEAAAIAARAGLTADELRVMEQDRRARRLRAWGVALVALGIGFGFAFFGMPQVLAVVLVVGAVFLGNAHAVARRKRQVLRRLEADQHH